MGTKRRPTAIEFIVLAFVICGGLFIRAGCMTHAPPLQPIDARCAALSVLIDGAEIDETTIAAKANTPLRFSGSFRWTDAVAPGTHFIHVAQIDPTTRQTVVSHLMTSGRETATLVEFNGDVRFESRLGTLLQISADVQQQGKIEGERRVILRAPLSVAQ